MTGREIIAKAIMHGGAWNSADAALAALAAAGYRILAPGDLDPVTLERAAKVADEHGTAWGLAMSTPATVIAAAIRALSGDGQ